MRVPPVSQHLPAVLVAFVLCAIALAVSPAPAQAQEPLEGKYRCVNVEAEHHRDRCQSPPLILHSDGTYEIWGEHGTYEVVQGRWLVLSHSKRRGLGHVQGPNQIVFEYRLNGKVCRVTFRRIFEATPGFSWG